MTIAQQIAAMMARFGLKNPIAYDIPTDQVQQALTAASSNGSAAAGTTGAATGAASSGSGFTNALTSAPQYASLASNYLGKKAPTAPSGPQSPFGYDPKTGGAYYQDGGGTHSITPTTNLNGTPIQTAQATVGNSPITFTPNSAQTPYTPGPVTYRGPDGQLYTSNPVLNQVTPGGPMTLNNGLSFATGPTGNRVLTDGNNHFITVSPEQMQNIQQYGSNAQIGMMKDPTGKWVFGMTDAAGNNMVAVDPRPTVPVVYGAAAGSEQPVLFKIENPHYFTPDELIPPTIAPSNVVVPPPSYLDPTGPPALTSDQVYYWTRVNGTLTPVYRPGWENVRDANGNPIQPTFETDPVTGAKYVNVVSPVENRTGYDGLDGQNGEDPFYESGTPTYLNSSTNLNMVPKTEQDVSAATTQAAADTARKAAEAEANKSYLQKLWDKPSIKFAVSGATSAIAMWSLYTGIQGLMNKFDMGSAFKVGAGAVAGFFGLKTFLSSPMFKNLFGHNTSMAAMVVMAAVAIAAILTAIFGGMSEAEKAAKALADQVAPDTSPISVYTDGMVTAMTSMTAGLAAMLTVGIGLGPTFNTNQNIPGIVTSQLQTALSQAGLVDMNTGNAVGAGSIDGMTVLSQGTGINGQDQVLHITQNADGTSSVMVSTVGKGLKFAKPTRPDGAYIPMYITVNGHLAPNPDATRALNDQNALASNAVNSPSPTQTQANTQVGSGVNKQ
jgi:hypothetical protein